MVKKANKKRTKKTKPTVNRNEFEAWFLKLPRRDFFDLCKKWNDQHFKIKIPKLDSYDDWLNYFKKLPATTVQQLQSTGQGVLTTEAFSALRMWTSIIESPEKIVKIHQSALTKEKNKKEKTALDLARENDVLGVLRKIRDDLVVKQENASIKDLPNVSRAISEVMTQISDIERRQAPQQSTYLGQLLGETEKIKISKKRAGKAGGGARTNSFKSRVTIKDLEG